MIGSVQELDILEDLKRGHHVFIDVPLEGGEAALDYHSNEGQGYGLLYYLQEEHPTLQIREIPGHKKYTGEWAAAKDLIGDMVDVYDESDDVTWHFVYTHSTEGGHVPEPHWEYAKITEKLDEWWSEHEEDIPMHGVHCVLFGGGSHHGRIGAYRSKQLLMLGVLANSECEFDLRYQ